MTDLGIVQDGIDISLCRVRGTLRMAKTHATAESIRAIKETNDLKRSHKYDFIAREIDRLISRLDEMEG